jgi:hypothetical protein
VSSVPHACSTHVGVPPCLRLPCPDRKGAISQTYAKLNRIEAAAYELVVAPLWAHAASGKARQWSPAVFGVIVAALVHRLVREFSDEGLLASEETLKETWSESRQRTTSEVTSTMLHGMLAT